MNPTIDKSDSHAWRDHLTGWMPHAVAIIGLILSYFDSRFLILAAAGFFGPGVLGELGWIRLEEFRQETRWRASHQAFLVAGILLAVISGFEGCGQRYGSEIHEIDDAVPASFVLTILLAVYYLSSLIRYWGSRVAAFRILVTYGSVFAVLYGLGLFLARGLMKNFPWGDTLQIAGFTAIVIGAAFLCRRLPRVAALLVCGATAWMLWFTGAWRVLGNPDFPWEINFEVAMYFLVLPGAAVGALLFGGADRA